MKVFLTGADGLLGNNIARKLLASGYAVKALFERGKKSKTYDELTDVECVEGDILNADEMKQLMEGCELVIHAAANTNINPARAQIICRVNIEGTRNVMDAAIYHHVKRFIFVGTANSFSPGTKSNPGNETNAYNGFQYKTDYMDSKYEAYLLIKDAVKNKGLNAITVHPTFMIGPYDTKPSSGAMILAISQQKVPGYTKGGRNYIYVKDAATAVVNALQNGIVGESYILGNENLNYKEAFTLIAEKIGAKPPSVYFPPFITLAYGWLGDVMAKISGKPATVSYPMARISCDEHYYSSAKAVQALKMPQTPIADIIPEAYQWLIKNHPNQ